MKPAISRGTYRINARTARSDLEVVPLPDVASLHKFLKKATGRVKYTRTAWAALKKDNDAEYKKCKEGFGWYVGGIVEGMRLKENVRARCVVTFDLERGWQDFKDSETSVVRKVLRPSEPMQRFDRFVAGLRREIGLVVYKSTGYTDEEPRYRVLALLDTPLEDQGQFVRVSRWLAQHLEIAPWVAPESYHRANAMFVPMDFAEDDEDLLGEHTSALTLLDGPPLDVAQTLIKAGAESLRPDIVYDPEDEQYEDPIVEALRTADLSPVPHKDFETNGAYNFTCPFFEGHGVKHSADGNDGQTTYFPATAEKGPVVKCLDTALDHDGPHLNYRSLVEWLKEEGYLRAVPHVLPVGAGHLPVGRLIEDFMDGRFVYQFGAEQWLQFSSDSGYRNCTQEEHVAFVAEHVEPWLTDLLRRTPAETPRHDQVTALLRTVRDKTGLAGALSFTRTQGRVKVGPDAFDKEPLLLGVRNGLFDLATQQLRPYAPRVLVRKRAGTEWDENAKAPMWAKFLKTVVPDAELRAYLQRLAGYLLTGDVSQEKLFFLYGKGANGKSTFVETLQALLGDYAVVVRSAVLMRSGMDRNAGSATPELIPLMGARLALAHETEAGSKLSGKKVKELASTDSITARANYGNEISFKPTAKIVVVGNHKPIVTDTDAGLWRRLVLLPFEHTIPETKRDPDFKRKLLDELPGILVWAVQGWVQLRDAVEDPLAPPAVATAAIQCYRDESDLLGSWLSECAELGAAHHAVEQDAYENYRGWCQDNGTHAWSKNQFTRTLVEDHGCTPGVWRGGGARGKSVRHYQGFRLRATG